MSVTGDQIDRVDNFIRSSMRRLTARQRFELALDLAERYAGDAADFVIPGVRACKGCGRPLNGRRNKAHCNATCRQRARRKRMHAA